MEKELPANLNHQSRMGRMIEWNEWFLLMKKIYLVLSLNNCVHL